MPRWCLGDKLHVRRMSYALLAEEALDCLGISQAEEFDPTGGFDRQKRTLPLERKSKSRSA